MDGQFDTTYTEIHELSSFSRTHFKDNFNSNSTGQEEVGGFEYLTMDESERGRPEVTSNSKPRDVPRGKTREGPITYRRAVEMEDENKTLYENTLPPSPSLPRFVAAQTYQCSAKEKAKSYVLQVDLLSYQRSAEDFHYETPSTSFSSSRDFYPSTTAINPPAEINLGFCKKLEINRRTRGCRGFVCYAMDAVLKEVEQNMLIDVLSSCFSIGVLVLGFLFLTACKGSSQIPVVLICSGGLNSVANAMNLVMTDEHRRKKCVWGRDTTRAIRIVLFVLHAYGLVLVYLIYPPEEYDKSSGRYCNPYLYWIGFAYYHLFTLSSAASVIAMILVPMYFLCSCKTHHSNINEY